MIDLHNANLFCGVYIPIPKLWGKRYYYTKTGNVDPDAVLEGDGKTVCLRAGGALSLQFAANPDLQVVIPARQINHDVGTQIFLLSIDLLCKGR